MSKNSSEIEENMFHYLGIGPTKADYWGLIHLAVLT